MAAKVASRQKKLKVVAPAAPEAPATPPSELEDVVDASQAAETASKLEQRKANDPISAPLEYGPWVLDQNPTQIFGMKLIDDVKGDIDLIPKWRFKRWYFRDKIIIDTFMTEAEYAAADVEGRRAMAKSYGVRYAALGPRHTVNPHQDKKMRAAYPSQVEQLGLV